MGLTDFSIVFDNPWATYYAGQTVTGNVVLSLNSLKKVRGICVRIKGEAKVQWSSDKRELDNSGEYRDETLTVMGYEEYFNTKYYLVGSPSGGEIEIQAGEHKFPFTCALPAVLPSSFESDFGFVRYTVKATLDRPWKFDQDVKAPFTVVAPFDLNTKSEAAESINLEASKTFCCLCCVTPPLTMNIQSPVKGFVPGQPIPLKLYIENNTNINVNSIKSTLAKVVTFKATTPRTEERTEEMIVKEISDGPIEPGQNTSLQQIIWIPPLPPSNLTNCGIIDLRYELKFEACVEGWYNRNLKKSVEVFVGTVPITTYMIPRPPSPEESASEAPSAPPYSPTERLYPELPPPSYMESLNPARNLRERDESEHVIGLKSNFAPRYPVYNFKDIEP